MHYTIHHVLQYIIIMYILVDCKDWKVICVDYVPILCNVSVLGPLLFSNCWIINFSAYLCTCVYFVWFKLVLHIVAIQWLDHSHSNCSQTSYHPSCRWYCAGYQLWSTGLQLCMHPVCQSDGLFLSTGCGTPSALPTHACTPVVLSLSLGIPWKKHWAFWHAVTLCPPNHAYNHVSTNIYSCHSSAVCSRHLHGIMESQCRAHRHSVQFVCGLCLRQAECDLDDGTSRFHLCLLLLPLMSTVWRNIPSKISLTSHSPFPSPSSYIPPPPPTHVCRPVPLLTVYIYKHSVFCSHRL